MTKVQEDILMWLAGSRDFDTGIELFKKVSRNTFYISNLQMSRRQRTLVYELEKVVRKEFPSNFQKGGGKGKEAGSGKSQSQVVEGKEQTPSVTINRDSSSSRTNAQRGQTGATNKPAANNKFKFVIRDEFPFLGRDDCPNELKVLVADMLTTHERYVLAHRRLFEVAHKSEDVCYDTAHELVENYLVNRQIWDELEHYKKTGKILGEHPVFAQRKRDATLKQMSAEEIEKRIKNLKRQLKYRENRLKKNRKNEDVAERKNEMQALKEEIRELEFRVQGSGFRV
jgi:hypothetical protein